MHDDKLRNLWKSANSPRSGSEEMQKLTEIQHTKIRSSLRSFRMSKVVLLSIGVVWLILVAFLIYKAWILNLYFFVASAGIHFTISAAAIGVYLHHLLLIRQLDLSTSIMEAQEKLAKLQGSTIEITRWLFLQLPVFTTFQVNESMLDGHPALWALQACVTIGFTWLGVWLFRNIDIRNADKKWFRLIFRGPDWAPLIEAKRFVEELERFKSED